MNTNNTQHIPPEDLAHAIQLARRSLDQGVDALPHDITERLRVARLQALAHKSANQTVPTHAQRLSDKLLNWLQRMPTLAKLTFALPALFLAIFVAHTTTDGNLAQPEFLKQSKNLAAHSAYSPVDTANALNIEAILNEKVPLQAYLNDDFNAFVERTSIATQVEFNPNSTVQTHTQNKDVRKNVQKNTIVQTLQ